jgi:hypothetical protein
MPNCPSVRFTSETANRISLKVFSLEANTRMLRNEFNFVRVVQIKISLYLKPTHNFIDFPYLAYRNNCS